MKKLLILCLMMVGLQMANAQQQFLFTQYMFNGLALNPAYAGAHEGMSASAIWREQWVGFEGAPSTQTVSLHSPISYTPISLGGVVYRDKIGIFEENGAYLSYAYRIKFKGNFLSFGMQANMQNLKAGYADLQPDDPTLGNISTFKFNFGSGVFLHSKRFYVGVSVPKIVNTKIDPKSVESASELIRHYFLTGGYVWEMNPNVIFKPNFLLKAVQGAPLQFDANLNVLLKNFLWVGASYRSKESIDALIEFQVSPRMQIGYAYDFFTLTDIRGVQQGSHELMLNYVFPLPNSKILTPRYF